MGSNHVPRCKATLWGWQSSEVGIAAAKTSYLEAIDPYSALKSLLILSW